MALLDDDSFDIQQLFQHLFASKSTFMQQFQTNSTMQKTQTSKLYHSQHDNFFPVSSKALTFFISLTNASKALIVLVLAANLLEELLFMMELHYSTIQKTLCYEEYTYFDKHILSDFAYFLFLSVFVFWKI